MNAQIRMTRCRGAAAALVVAGMLVACDRGAGELVRELDAARAGCSEEKLRSGDEECVRMFERYAEMGADALETYIGAMRALDQALRRSDATRFDTTGLGRALTGHLRTEADSAAGPETSQDRWPWLDPDEASGGAGEGWSTGTGARPPRPEHAGEWVAFPESDGPYGRDGFELRSRPPAAPRGVLLPPAERLRRPWIGGVDADPEYLDRRGTPPVDPPELTGQRGGRGPYDPHDLLPYPP
jgi:hypothetical protein